ncbi:DUF4391 domain-containing protein [Ralstonia sp. 24A2]|uniref:DUF4391 domain-containing protein n=1 Tax=Ralstonia sp. 24A2 TaxID=3447364 RepID=UPI003F69944A
MSSAKICGSDVLIAMTLPTAAMVQQRIPKKMLAEHGAATLADRRLVQDRIEELTWCAALKPSNVGIAAYEDEVRSYLEVAILSVRLRAEETAYDQPHQQALRISTAVKRAAELIHRAVPYPTVLLLEEGRQLFVSMVHVRWAQREAEKIVLDGDSIVAAFNTVVSDDKTNTALNALLSSLALSRQPRTHFLALYQGWFDVLSAWQVVELTGQFRLSESPEQASERRAALRTCQELDARITAARSAASKEKQLARQVAANLEIKGLLAERQLIAQSL